LLAGPRYAERQTEQGARASQLARAGFEVQAAPTARFEGGDVVVLPHLPAALLGYGFRSEAGAARPLARFLDRHVIPLELTDPSLYHLDTPLAVLDDGSVLVCEEAFTRASLRMLRSLAFTAYFRVPRTEALGFALNFVELGAHVVSGSDGVTTGVQTSRALAARGLRLVATPLGQFHLAGGSAACLSAQIFGADSGHREQLPLAA